MIDTRTISIHPNTIGFGYVILNEKGEIIDCGIVSIRPINNNKCIKKICEIVTYYQPNILIVENPENSNKSERVKKLIKQICEGGKNRFKIFKYTKAEVLNTFEIFKAKNKFEISRKISEVYPELKSKLPEKRKVWEPENYYQGIFDAMALVLTHYYLTE